MNHPPRTIGRLLGGAALALAALTAACTTGRRVDTADLLGAESPAARALQAQDAYPVVKRAETSTWSDRAGAGDFMRAVAPGADPDSWLVTDSRDGRTLTEDLFVRNPKGDVVLVKTTSHVEGVISWFAPALVVMPAELAPGETFRQTTSIKVFPIDDPDNVRDQGPVTQELTLEAEQSFGLSGGPTPARRVRAVFTTKLSAASVVKTTDLWFVGGRRPGLVAERSEEVVKALGLTVRTTRRFLALESD
ncbi:MAG: hypothetical protein IBJ10_07465 [Phycisphaerales bacterium]|nr:hypothetical protein [Phycisphaerales bacterium]